MKGAPHWMQLAFEVVVLVFVIMTLLSIVVGLWVGGCILRKRAAYIAEIQAFPPRITFHPKETVKLPSPQ